MIILELAGINLKKNPEKWARSVPLDELESKITDLKNKYYTGEAEVSDSVYDILEDVLRELKPKSKALKTGFSLTKDKLPFPMPSLEKAKSEKEIK
jgi:NAD-dependent DNA ligase